jgi:hypothetical protein
VTEPDVTTPVAIAADVETVEEVDAVPVESDVAAEADAPADESVEQAEPEEPATASLESFTVAQLRARARDEGRTGYSRLTKQQLIALLSS